MTCHCKKPLHLAVEELPAHKTKLVKDYAASTNGLLTVHFLPGYAPELNPDELVWSHMKRTGLARNLYAKERSSRKRSRLNSPHSRTHHA